MFNGILDYARSGGNWIDNNLFTPAGGQGINPAMRDQMLAMGIGMMQPTVGGSFGEGIAGGLSAFKQSGDKARDRALKERRANAEISSIEQQNTMRRQEAAAAQARQREYADYINSIADPTQRARAKLMGPKAYFETQDRRETDERRDKLRRERQDDQQAFQREQQQRQQAFQQNQSQASRDFQAREFDRRQTAELQRARASAPQVQVQNNPLPPEQAPTNTSLTRAQGTMDASASVINTVNELKSILKPQDVGMVGSIRRGIQGMAGQGEAIGAWLSGATTTIQDDVISDQADVNLGFFDPALPQQELMLNVLAYQSARMNDPGGRVSDKDLEAAKASLQASGAFTGAADVYTALDSLETMARRNYDIAERRAKGEGSPAGTADKEKSKAPTLTRGDDGVWRLGE